MARGGGAEEKEEGQKAEAQTGKGLTIRKGI